MLRIVTAFKTEALPLIEHYALRPRAPRGAFDIYENGDHALVISGLGKARAAAAAAYLHACTGERRGALWLNAGVAGHRDLPPGTLVVAHKVVDTGTGQAWYPPQIVKHTLPTATLYTVDRPEDDYTRDGLYDMEAAAFYAVAAGFESRERVQCCKIVSDNRAQPVSELTPRHAGELIRQATPQLLAFIEALARHAHVHAVVEPADMQPFLERWHFSVTQQHQLRRSLERRAALQAGTGIADFEHCRNARELLRELNTRLDEQATRGG
jgi:hypothetical protein